jgi:hypothetical protein
VEAVGELIAASSPLRNPFKDPHHFHVAKDRLCQVLAVTNHSSLSAS